MPFPWNPKGDIIDFFCQSSEAGLLSLLFEPGLLPRASIQMSCRKTVAHITRIRMDRASINFRLLKSHGIEHD